MIALRTQQILGLESGAASTVDPLAGSYYVESLTDRIEADAMELISRIDELGGAPAAIESGFQQREIDEAAYRFARSVDDGSTAVVGVNSFVVDAEGEPEVMVVDRALEAHQISTLETRRAARDNDAVGGALAAVTETARGSANLLYPMKDALSAGATIGEVTGALLPVFGRYRPTF